MKENTPIKTFEEVELAIQNLIERMNRIEAWVAHQKPVTEYVVKADKLTIADSAIASIDSVIDQQAQTTKLLASLASSLRNGK